MDKSTECFYSPGCDSHLKFRIVIILAIHVFCGFTISAAIQAKFSDGADV